MASPYRLSVVPGDVCLSFLNKNSQQIHGMFINSAVYLQADCHTSGALTMEEEGLGSSIDSSTRAAGRSQ
jgi:hypothetical protein